MKSKVWATAPAWPAPHHLLPPRCQSTRERADYKHWRGVLRLPWAPSVRDQLIVSKNQPAMLHHTSTYCVRGLSQLRGAHIFIHTIVLTWHCVLSLHNFYNNTTIHLIQEKTQSPVREHEVKFFSFFGSSPQISSSPAFFPCLWFKFVFVRTWPVHWAQTLWKFPPKHIIHSESCAWENQVQLFEEGPIWTLSSCCSRLGPCSGSLIFKSLWMEEAALIIRPVYHRVLPCHILISFKWTDHWGKYSTSVTSVGFSCHCFGSFSFFFFLPPLQPTCFIVSKCLLVCSPSKSFTHLLRENFCQTLLSRINSM